VLDEELLAFVNHQIRAEEALARGASERNGAHWWCPSTGLLDLNGDDLEADVDQVIVYDRDVAEHMAEHDPRRVLVECAAKRYLIAAVTNKSPEEAAVLGDLPDVVLLLLAAPYAWEDDFQPRWELPRLVEEYGSDPSSRVVVGEVVQRAKEIGSA
jgi:hypothetical protein